MYEDAVFRSAEGNLNCTPTEWMRARFLFAHLPALFCRIYCIDRECFWEVTVRICSRNAIRGIKPNNFIGNCSPSILTHCSKHVAFCMHAVEALFRHYQSALFFSCFVCPHCFVAVITFQKCVHPTLVRKAYFLLEGLPLSCFDSLQGGMLYSSSFETFKFNISIMDQLFFKSFWPMTA